MQCQSSFTEVGVAVSSDQYGGDRPRYGRSAGRDALRDILGIAWVLGACAALVYPALRHGALLGP